MKILQINKLYYPVIGGIETVVKDIAEGLNSQADLKIEVLACQNKGHRQIENINGVKVYRAAAWGKKLGMPLSVDFFRLFFAIHQQYDKFILHYPFPLAALISPFIPKNKLIIYYHSDIIRQKLGAFIFSPIIKYSLHKADKILVTSRNLVDSSPLLKPYKSKCSILPLGFKADYNETDYQAAAKIKQAYSPQQTLILAVGRLVYYKGFDYAIPALKDLNAQLLIIGAGPEQQKLQDLIKKLNLENNIKIIGPQDNLKPFFLACDLFLFPSVARSEAFGLVQLEAMAAGKAIINTYLQTGVEEVSLNNISGLTVAPKNTEALQQALKTLITKPDLRIKLGQQGFERYQKLYTLTRFISRIKDSLNN